MTPFEKERQATIEKLQAEMDRKNKIRFIGHRSNLPNMEIEEMTRLMIDQFHLTLEAAIKEAKRRYPDSKVFAFHATEEPFMHVLKANDVKVATIRAMIRVDPKTEEHIFATTVEWTFL